MQTFTAEPLRFPSERPARTPLVNVIIVTCKGADGTLTLALIFDLTREAALKVGSRSSPVIS